MFGHVTETSLSPDVCEVPMATISFLCLYTTKHIYDILSLFIMDPSSLENYINSQ